MPGNMKIALTGGSGFLGKHLLALFAARGLSVRALARSEESAKKIGNNAKIIHGDLENGAGLADLVRNQDTLIHMASLLFGSGWQDYLKTNTEACRQLIQAIQSLPENEQPKKIIFISSLAAAGPCAHLPGKDEKQPETPVSAYGWSKLLCEKMLRAAFGSRLLVLRPAIIYGSGDKGLLPMFRLAKKGFGISPGLSRKFPVSAIHASDAAHAVLLSLNKNASDLYHLCDNNPYDMDIICEAMAKAQGRQSVRMLHMPLPVMAFTASLSGLWNLVQNFSGEKTGPTPQWNLDKYRESREPGWLGNSSKISKELGFKAKMNLDAGMREAVAGYRAGGWL